MLSKSRKITRQTFPHHQFGGFVAHALHISCVFFSSKEEGSRFSAVISKKIATSSPARHLWKRRVYEAISRYEKTINGDLLPGAYVFYAKKGAPAISYVILAGEVESLLESVRKTINK